MIFSSPMFLWALGLLAIPIIIHLFQFRRYKRLYFPDISLLKEVKTKSQTKNQIRHLLILAARMLFLALLIMAFAEPLIPSKNEASEQVNLVAIYVDNSFSMQNQGENGRMLNDALQKAFEIAENYPNETCFQLITNDLPPHQKRFNDFETFLTELDAVELSPHFQGLQRIIEFHEQGKREHGEGRSILYLLSDFVNTLDSNTTVTDSLVLLRAIPMTGVYAENISVDSVWAVTPIIQPGKEQQLYLRIHNHGAAPRTDIPLEVRIEGSIISTLNLTLEPGQVLDTTVAFIINEARSLLGEVTVEDSPIDFDNHYYFDIEVQPRITVLEVAGAGEASRSPFARLFAGDDFEYRHTLEGQIKQDSAAGVDLLVLNEVQRWSSGLFALIKDMGTEGKSVLIVLPAEMNEEGRASLSEEFAISVGTLDTASLEVNKVMSEDELFAGVFESQPKNLNYPFVRGHHKVISGNGLESIMTLFDGDPLLFALNNGSGRVFVITSPLQDRYTNLHRHALFVPAVFNMALTSGMEQHMAYPISAQKIKVRQRLSETARITSLSDSAVFIPGISYDGILLNNRIRKAGSYNLVEGDKRMETFSFNYDRRESSLEQVSPEQLELALTRIQPGSEVLGWSDDDIQAEIHQADIGLSLWPLFIALALFFLLAESALIKLFVK